MKEILRSELICERCKQPIRKLDKNEFGDSIDWHTPFEQFLCDECCEKIWDELMDDCCPRCNTHPCEKNRDCWINPFPHIMYLCYVAPRINPTPIKLILDINNNILHPQQETLDVFS